jgi:teichuronic acid exporter
MIALLILYTLPIYVGLWWLAEPFIVVVYGKHWADTAVPLQILAPLGLLYCILHPCGAVLTATNRVGREVVAQTVTWILVGLGCYFGLRWGLAGVAFGIVLSQIYLTIHMYLLANQCFRARLTELLSTVGPGLLLNAILITVLIAVDRALPSDLRKDSMAAYLLISTLTGFLVYSGAFLLIPLRLFASEVLRWKKLLRLSR